MQGDAAAGKIDAIPPRRARWFKAANAVAGILLLVMAIALWRDPGLLIRAEFTKQRMLLGATSQELVVGDDRWTYVERAADRINAPTIVMLHGYTGSKENWYRLARQLSGRYRIVIPDLPGWGESERKPDADYGYLAQADRVSAFIAQISHRPVVLLGHSMGGGIAALVAARAPGRVDRIGLIDAAGTKFNENPFGVEVQAGKNPFSVTDDASLERYLATVFEDPQTRPWMPWPATSLYIAQRRRDAGFEQHVLDRIGRSDERFLPGVAARAIVQPTLLLWCEQDRVIDPSAMTHYAEAIPQASQVMLQHCGHMSLMERPRDVSAAVEMLIERGQPR